MRNRKKILFAEDEEALGSIVKESLEVRGFDVTYCKDGEKALEIFMQEAPDLLILDVMMPKKDGFTLIKDIRRMDQQVPVIFLTAKSEIEDLVKGFGYGANDYIKKPFSMEELIVRMQALLGRKARSDTDPIALGTYQFDPYKQQLKHDDGQIILTHRESQLLEALYLHKNELASRKEILLALWGSDDFFNGRSMDVFISRLRKKLSKDPLIKILNVKGQGYKLIC